MGSCAPRWARWRWWAWIRPRWGAEPKDGPALGAGGGAMIELLGVVKAYGGAPAAGPLSLSTPAGTFVAILGGSGSGKTTTLKMINGLVVPDAGEVRIDGAPTGATPGHLLRRRMGYVFQEVGLFPHMSVGENIAVVPRLAGCTPERTAQRLTALLELVALPGGPASRPPRAWSAVQPLRVRPPPHPVP